MHKTLLAIALAFLCVGPALALADLSAAAREKADYDARERSLTAWKGAVGDDQDTIGAAWVACRQAPAVALMNFAFDHSLDGLLGALPRGAEATLVLGTESVAQTRGREPALARCDAAYAAIPVDLQGLIEAQR